MGQNAQKHTPGPWHAVDMRKLKGEGWMGADWYICMSDPLAGPDYPDGSIAPIAKISTLNHPMDNANARLIAAAPELLQELKNVLAYLKDDDETAERYARIIGNAEATIVKAEWR